MNRSKKLFNSWLSVLLFFALVSGAGLLGALASKLQAEKERRCTKWDVVTVTKVTAKRTTRKCGDKWGDDTCEYTLTANVVIRNRCPSKDFLVYRIICGLWISPPQNGFSESVTAKFKPKAAKRSGGSVTVQLTDTADLPVGTKRVGIKECTVYSVKADPEPSNSVEIGGSND